MEEQNNQQLVVVQNNKIDLKQMFQKRGCVFVEQVPHQLFQNLSKILDLTYDVQQLPIKAENDQNQQNQIDYDKLYMEFFKSIKIWPVQLIQKPKKLIKSQSLLTNITPIQFVNLNILRLIDAKLSNIQPIAWLDCPNLSCIQLQKNQLFNINCLSKTKFQITRLIIQQKNIPKRIQTKYLNRIKFDKQTNICIVFDQQLRIFRFNLDRSHNMIKTQIFAGNPTYFYLQRAYANKKQFIQTNFYKIN